MGTEMAEKRIEITGKDTISCLIPPVLGETGFHTFFLNKQGCTKHLSTLRHSGKLIQITFESELLVAKLH